LESDADADAAAERDWERDWDWDWDRDPNRERQREPECERRCVPSSAKKSKEGIAGELEAIDQGRWKGTAVHSERYSRIGAPEYHTDLEWRQIGL
jgi:hypothetical protein